MGCWQKSDLCNVGRLLVNLINDPWMPVQHKSGAKSRIAPWQITERKDPALSLRAGRPDFDGALMQFLIGLFQTWAYFNDKGEHDEWEALLDDPPMPKDLQKELNKKYVNAFDVSFDAPKNKSSFMEDSDRLNDKKPCDIDRMLIDYPGEKTLKENTDHFIKRDTIKALCPSCAITALFTLQTNAPSGGAGHRTSLRGGGPLTTLIVPDNRDEDCELGIWREVWMNVLPKEDIDGKRNGGDNRPNDIFPWLGKTRTSAKNDPTLSTTPEDAHPLQAYWGMPRRIRIDWKHKKTGKCDLCDEYSDQLVTRYRTKSYGVNYEGAWTHSLTPYQQVDGTKPPSPRKAKPGCLVYRHWTDYVDMEKSAKVVKRYSSRKIKTEQLLLYVFGFDVDKAKARCWYETRFPIFPNIHDEERMKEIDIIIDTAKKCAWSLRKCIKDAWTTSTKGGDVTFLDHEFYQKTEGNFYKSVKLVMGEKRDKAYHEWYGILEKTANNMFDSWAMQGDFTYSNPKAISKAKKNLDRSLSSLEKSLKKTNKKQNARGVK